MLLCLLLDAVSGKEMALRLVARHPQFLPLKLVLFVHSCLPSLDRRAEIVSFIFEVSLFLSARFGEEKANTGGALHAMESKINL